MIRLAVLVAAVVVLVSAAGANGGGPQPLAFGQSFDQYTPWIKQQQTAPGEPHNPFGSACKWSVDDQHWEMASGYLDPGASAVETKCVVSDWAFTHPYGFSTGYLISKSANVRLSVCFVPQGRCFEPVPIWLAVEKRYRSSFCVRAHYNPDDPLMTEIAGSGGGTGLVTTVTTTVSNTGGQRVRDIVAQAGFASDLAPNFGWQSAEGCLLAEPHVDRFEYPFEWTSS